MDKQSKSRPTRRDILTATGLMLAAIPLAHSADVCSVFAKDLQAATTPALALERLKAGNFLNPDITGSLEYATKVAGAKLVVVLGHTDCGAVKGAIDDVKSGNLTTTLANIRPSVAEVTARKGKSTSNDKKFVQAVAEQNVHDALHSLGQHSEVLTGLVSAGRLAIVAAMHDVSTGAVTWLG